MGGDLALSEPPPDFDEILREFNELNRTSYTMMELHGILLTQPLRLDQLIEVLWVVVMCCLFLLICLLKLCKLKLLYRITSKFIFWITICFCESSNGYVCETL